MFTEFEELQELRKKGFSFTLAYDGDVYVFFSDPLQNTFSLAQSVYEGNSLDHALLACDAFLETYYGGNCLMLDKEVVKVLEQLLDDNDTPALYKLPVKIALNHIQEQDKTIG